MKEKKKKPGRPLGNVEKNKKGVFVRLPPWLVVWLRGQEEFQSVLIEKALCDYYGLTAPLPSHPSPSSLSHKQLSGKDKPLTLLTTSPRERERALS